MATGLLILRVVIGALFVGHGTHKLFGWFGGHGLDGTARFMESLRYRNGRVAAVAAGLAETAGGLLLILGFLTPLAAAAIIGVMLNAIATVHLRGGLWNTNGGIELPLMYAVMAGTLAFTGPGAFSVDSWFDLSMAGIPYGIGAALIGVLAGVAALALRRAESSSRAPDALDEEGVPVPERSESQGQPAAS